MRGASGDAARRDKDRAAGPSNAAFEDYIKFEDMFGASSIFTTGTARQKQREREAYVKDVMERKLYGYCLLYTSPSPRDATLSRMPSSA